MTADVTSHESRDRDVIATRLSLRHRRRDVNIERALLSMNDACKEEDELTIGFTDRHSDTETRTCHEMTSLAR